LGIIATLILVGTAAIYCTVLCGIYDFSIVVLVTALAYILGAVANYEYDVYAQPIGREKQQMQATADDEEFQAEIGKVVEEFIEDPLSYSMSICQRVADREIELAKLQRKRLSLEKITHLQDEVGDVVSFPHPYGGHTMKLMITEITRTYNRPKPGSNTGHCLDVLEGWGIS
jgi:hypothetical protein